MNVRKKALIFGATIAAFVLTSAQSCDSADTREERLVNDQQSIYSTSQPIPRYDWSLARHLWIQFYDSQNTQVTTFSYIRPALGEAPSFECASQGYALPRDTQLTNPTQVAANGSTIEQAEPNGLFTSKNTNQTVIFCLNEDGTVAPVLTEEFVTAFPFPVTWEGPSANYPKGRWVRVGTDSNVRLDTSR